MTSTRAAVRKGADLHPESRSTQSYLVSSHLLLLGDLMDSPLRSFWQWFTRWRIQRRVASITPAYARQRVRRGASYLDELDPGWHTRVDPDTLELASGRACVLGQLHGDFRMGLGRAQILNLTSAPRASLSPVAYGFQCLQRVPDTAQDRDYDLLNHAWQEAVRERQRTDAASAPPIADDQTEHHRPGEEVEQVQRRQAPELKQPEEVMV